MENIFSDIFDVLRRDGTIDATQVERILRAHSKGLPKGTPRYAKKQLLPYYQYVKEHEPQHWAQWNVTEDMEKALVRAVQMKPRRTASGVATITVLTKPWQCANECLYCPNDIRMPKSYLTDEPACQRAEHAFFDPYLQVAGRLRALNQMGHTTDKIELIVLGGTWSDYPRPYQIWFIHELFRALNDAADTTGEREENIRRAFYEAQGISNDPDKLSEQTAHAQQAVLRGEQTYNQVVRARYNESTAWQYIASTQTATLDEVYAQHTINETTRHRVVGLVVETRPDAVTVENLTLMRALGCTKVQIGIQSLDPAILAVNNRATTVDHVRRAFQLLRAFGFKTHVHAMVNLLGATPDADKRDYLRLVTEPDWLPDEVKLYPCALVDGTGLVTHAHDGSWRPYSENELVDVLATDVATTPPYVRISRMIRDISAKDILAGNKKGNLRQMVEGALESSGAHIQEIRHREIGTNTADLSSLTLDVVQYHTSTTREYFLQWITPDNHIAGFLRLSLPDAIYLREHKAELPVHEGEAMIREVHVYGRAADIHGEGQNAQHLGLGRALVERACTIARGEGYARANVISAVGTREYYRHLGFYDNGLYQRIDLG